MQADKLPVTFQSHSKTPKCIGNNLENRNSFIKWQSERQAESLEGKKVQLNDRDFNGNQYAGEANKSNV